MYVAVAYTPKTSTATHTLKLRLLAQTFLSQLSINPTTPAKPTKQIQAETGRQKNNRKRHARKWEAPKTPEKHLPKPPRGQQP
jgi:hypothetical protein